MRWGRGGRDGDIGEGKEVARWRGSEAALEV